ncbi:hypothetical protein QE152_g9536 [Popillia japonica]|uniref:Uncharacterized protein n=1 Tax=Popillia japonica TaxID=7064 RepID=A0AAW1LY19_POPJA
MYDLFWGTSRFHYIDTNAILYKEDFTKHGLHLNDRGRQKLYARIASVITDSLTKRKFNTVGNKRKFNTVGNLIEIIPESGAVDPNQNTTSEVSTENLRRSVFNNYDKKLLEVRDGSVCNIGAQRKPPSQTSHLATSGEGMGNCDDHGGQKRMSGLFQIKDENIINRRKAETVSGNLVDDVSNLYNSLNCASSTNVN